MIQPAQRILLRGRVGAGYQVFLLKQRLLKHAKRTKEISLEIFESCVRKQYEDCRDLFASGPSIDALTEMGFALLQTASLARILHPNPEVRRNLIQVAGDCTHKALGLVLASKQEQCPPQLEALIDAYQDAFHEYCEGTEEAFRAEDEANEAFSLRPPLRLRELLAVLLNRMKGIALRLRELPVRIRSKYASSGRHGSLASGGYPDEH